MLAPGKRCFKYGRMLLLKTLLKLLKGISDLEQRGLIAIADRYIVFPFNPSKPLPLKLKYNIWQLQNYLHSNIVIVLELLEPEAERYEVRAEPA